MRPFGKVQYLIARYEDREELKARGARWNASRKAWFITRDTDVEAFDKWLPESAKTLQVAKPAARHLREIRTST